MTFWPCCCSTCFKPCDCFARNCELHITSEGWTDNPATDCAGIADRVFNKTHVITAINVTSGPEYGFTCDFSISYDDLILTKEVGGNCICKTQPALYVIEGTIACARGEDGTYGLSMVLYFKVPVYDEDEGCSPSPCVLEPKWETWTANYTLISGNLTSSPICDFGANGLGPYTFNTDATAQTTCGYGLDGTDATVTLEWKFCDPSGGCADCCNETPEEMPERMQVTITGVVDDTNCDQCNEAVNGTFVLERLGNSSSGFGCCYVGSFDDPILCEIPGWFGLRWKFLNLTYCARADRDCQKTLRIWFSEPVNDLEATIGFFCDYNTFPGNDKCSEFNDVGMFWCGDESDTPLSDDYCDFSGATVTVSALP